MISKKVMSSDLLPLVKELLDNHQSVELTVSGTSMRPFYEDKKTVVTLEHPSAVKKYDVVLYLDKGSYKLHRVVRIKDTEFIICGDALKPLEYIHKHYIFGVVTKHTKGHRVILSRDSTYLKKVRFWMILKPIRTVLLRLIYARKRVL